MRLLYFINQITNSGGIERIVIDKINYLASLPNYQVYLFFYGTADDVPFYTIDDRIKRIPMSADVKGHSFVKKICGAGKIVSFVRKRINEVKPDVIVNANVWVVSYFLPFICRKIPKVIELHFSYDGLQIMNKEIYRSNKIKIAVNNGLRRLFYPCYDKCVVLTNDDAKKWNFKNLVVIPNFSNVRKSENVDVKREKIAISVGRLEYQKNHLILLKAWMPIAKKYPEWKLEIWGGGQLKGPLEEFINKMGLQDFVSLKGTTTEIQKQYQRASFFVLSSRYEGQPLVVIEAMQMGLPCVCFAITGTSDIIENGKNGFLATANDEKSLTNAIEQMILAMDSFEKFSRNAIASTLLFEKDNVMNLWIQLFENLKREKNENCN